jgi:Tol biopolymer transport system component
MRISTTMAKVMVPGNSFPHAHTSFCVRAPPIIGTTMNRIFFGICSALAIGSLAALAADGPRMEVRRWSPPGVSSDQFESHPAIDPRTGDFYFVRSGRDFSGWRILVARCTDSGWMAPVDAAFSGPGVEADPYFTPDGTSVYFISTRSTGSRSSKDLDIYRADRATDGTWRTPVRLPQPVNSPEAEWFPRPGPDGWLYFGSNRPGGFGGNDIWRAKSTARNGWAIENAGREINTPGDEYEPLPSPDGQRLLIEANDGFHVSTLAKGRWKTRQKLGRDLNENGSEIGAAFSPDGRSILFSRDTQGPDSGEIFLWTPEGRKDWPKDCRS